jgi:5-methylthioadenosine/S-adenosylhomocysteine deaminase
MHNSAHEWCEDSIREGTLAIKDDKIVFVGKSNSAMSIDADHRIDAKGKAVMPGFVNCHTHVPMTLFRGIAEDEPCAILQLPRQYK